MKPERVSFKVSVTVAVAKVVKGGLVVKFVFQKFVQKNGMNGVLLGLAATFAGIMVARLF